MVKTKFLPTCNRTICYCGGKRSKHTQEALLTDVHAAVDTLSAATPVSAPNDDTPDSPNPTWMRAWSAEEDTVEVPTDAFGEIQFTGSKNVAKFVRVSNVSQK